MPPKHGPYRPIQPHEVLNIRNLYDNKGQIKARDMKDRLAREYGVSLHVIENVLYKQRKCDTQEPSSLHACKPIAMKELTPVEPPPAPKSLPFTRIIPVRPHVAEQIGICLCDPLPTKRRGTNHSVQVR